ncbi:MAG: PH domain-containing protein, partial [Verrucomicrobiota bacterium]
LKNLQTTGVRETFFDRRLGLATLFLDCSGQTHTGGFPGIRHLPKEEAEALSNRLAAFASATRYR